MRSVTWLNRILISLLGILVIAASLCFVFLYLSLPIMDGQVIAAGLKNPVKIERDNMGVPTITGKSRVDIAYATGFLHAQDRFFEMDLMRRAAAGELSELFGLVTLTSDKLHRQFLFRTQAKSALAAASVSERALLDRYADGVNDGLRALRARPFEYGLLRSPPKPWQAEDSLLVIWAMYFDLQGNFGRKIMLGWLRAHTTPEQLAFLLPQSSEWDAPIDALSIADSETPIPETAPDWYGLPAQRMSDIRISDADVGSNNWALAGSRTKHGSAIVENDMHLGIALPPIWYRMVMNYGNEQGKIRRLVGVTLPGAPGIVAGSNGHVAWGFTNSYGDYFDLVELQRDPNDATRFRSARGWLPITTVEELIKVKGSGDETVTIQKTDLGPVRQVGDKAYAQHWIAKDPGAVNVGLIASEEANNLTELLTAASCAGIPSQNVVAGDSEGHIGWTIAGPLPDRLWQWAAQFPYDSTEEQRLGWIKLRKPTDYPRVIDPPSGQLWTANARQLAGPDSVLLGDGGFDPGARARQIRDDLTALGNTDEQRVYTVALDDRALFLAKWRDRALAALSDLAVQGYSGRAEFRKLLRDNWTGHASIDSVGYRLTHDYLIELYQLLFGNLDAILAKSIPEAGSFRQSRWEVVLGRLDDKKPDGWLPKGNANWTEVELAAIDQVIAHLTQNGTPMAKATWGLRNTADVSHLFARVMPLLKPWLSTPADQFAGDKDMPRVAGPNFGQSERMVVSPGHEDLGIFNMPGGPSGHPLSPYFLSGHENWVRGQATPLLPGPAKYTLTLTPG
jgi:penicillin amidase